MASISRGTFNDLTALETESAELECKFIFWFRLVPDKMEKFAESKGEIGSSGEHVLSATRLALLHKMFYWIPTG